MPGTARDKRRSARDVPNWRPHLTLRRTISVWGCSGLNLQRRRGLRGDSFTMRLKILRVRRGVRMVDTCAVFKLPVCCAACGSPQYETLLRISQGKPLVCVECRQSIDLPCDNSAIFSRAVAFVEGEQHAAWSPRLAVLADFAVNGRV